jgi:hypothetical protein
VGSQHRDPRPVERAMGWEFWPVVALLLVGLTGLTEA